MNETSSFHAPCFFQQCSASSLIPRCSSSTDLAAKTPSATIPVPPPPIRTPRSGAKAPPFGWSSEKGEERRRRSGTARGTAHGAPCAWRVGVVEGREFRTANYVNCRCCKLPSQFAFILHTIHTVPAHLAPESIHSDTVTSFEKETADQGGRGGEGEGDQTEMETERGSTAPRDGTRSSPPGTPAMQVVRHNRYSTTPEYLATLFSSMKTMADGYFHCCPATMTLAHCWGIDEPFRDSLMTCTIDSKAVRWLGVAGLGDRLAPIYGGIVGSAPI